MVKINKIQKYILFAGLFSLLFLATPVFAWERGNHAGTWTKGQTIKVCIDTPPGDAAQQAAYLEAVFEAMSEWNDAQAEFGGLKLDYANSGCDVQVKWQDNAPAWGSTSASTGPVTVTAESNDGLNSRGVTRTLKHEFGHVEGLGHSAASALMKEDAYSSTPGEAPSAGDLNSDDPFTPPTADDKAGKKTLYGTAEKLSKSVSTSQASFDTGSGLWQYKYILNALVGTGFIEPVTQFTLDLPHGVDGDDFVVTQLPSGWRPDFFEGFVSEEGKHLDTEESPSPSLLSFSAIDEQVGVLPGRSITFEIASLLEPVAVRAFTNSPSFDSDEFTVLAPAPTLDTDGDGVPDDEDGCPGTDLEASCLPHFLTQDGCSAEQLVDATCPLLASYRNHGQYMSCVAHAVENVLAEAGLIPGTEEYEEASSCLVNPGARSDIGKGEDILELRKELRGLVNDIRALIRELRVTSVGQNQSFKLVQNEEQDTEGAIKDLEDAIKELDKAIKLLDDLEKKKDDPIKLLDQIEQALRNALQKLRDAQAKGVNSTLQDIIDRLADIVRNLR